MYVPLSQLCLETAVRALTASADNAFAGMVEVVSEVSLPCLYDHLHRKKSHCWLRWVPMLKIMWNLLSTQQCGYTPNHMCPNVYLM